MSEMQNINHFTLSFVFLLFIRHNYDYTNGLYGKRSPELHEEISELPYS